MVIWGPEPANGWHHKELRIYAHTQHNQYKCQLTVFTKQKNNEKRYNMCCLFNYMSVTLSAAVAQNNRLRRVQLPKVSSRTHACTSAKRYHARCFPCASLLPAMIAIARCAINSYAKIQIKASNVCVWCVESVCTLKYMLH